MSGGQSDLDALRVQAEEIKDEIKAKRKECRDTTMQQVSQKKIFEFFIFFGFFFERTETYETTMDHFWTDFGPKMDRSLSDDTEEGTKSTGGIRRVYKLYW